MQLTRAILAMQNTHGNAQTAKNGAVTLSARPRVGAMWMMQTLKFTHEFTHAISTSCGRMDISAFEMDAIIHSLPDERNPAIVEIAGFSLYINC